MAVTKIWPIKGRVGSPLDYVANEEKTENPKWDKSSLANLTDVMHYAADDDKTQKQFFVTGINCNADTARDQFVTVKKQFDKEDGIVAYHGYQSFAEGEVTPEQAHAIGLEMAQRLWGDRFQVVVATHLNTRCYHNHFVVNSVSFRDGKRCRVKQWYEINKVSDEICRAHGLSVVEHPKGKGVPVYIRDAERAGKPTRLNIAKDAVDEAIRVSSNMREFRIVLESMGYVCNFEDNRKHWIIRQNGWKKPIRMSRMGDDYTNDRIRERIMSKEKSFILFQRALIIKRQYRLPTRGNKIRKVGGLKGLYLHYCYLLGYLPRYRQRTIHVSPLLRDDLLRMEQIADETRMLCREKIETMEQLREYRNGLIEKISETEQTRSTLQKKARRKIPEEQKQELKTQSAELNAKLKGMRKEIRMTERIEAQSEGIREKVEQTEKESERIEVRRDELRR